MVRADVLAPVGARLEPRSYRVTRDDLLRYAAVSGDDNPIHQDDEAARSLGLTGVVAHGMLTMALAARAVTDWAGGPGQVRHLGCRFARPVPVPPAPGAARVDVAGRVCRVDEEGVHISLEVSCDGRPVLAVARAVVASLAAMR